MSDEQRTKWLKGLKVGDEVAVDCGGYTRTVQFLTVDRITKSHGGTIHVGKSSYDTERGYERARKSGYGPFYHLAQPTQELKDWEEARRLRSQISYWFSKDENMKVLSLQDLKTIEALVQQAIAFAKPAKKSETD